MGVVYRWAWIGTALGLSLVLLVGAPHLSTVAATTFGEVDESDASPGGPQPLSIVPMEVLNVTITTSPPGLTVVVDGVAATSPLAFAWENGSFHVLDVPSPQANGSIRHAFANWSDSGAAQHSIQATASTDLVVSFRTEYLANISTSPPGLNFVVDGEQFAGAFEGWWVGDSRHTLYAVELQSSNDTRRAFATWSDGGHSVHDVVASGPIVLTATWSSVFLLTVETPFGSGSGCKRPPCWFDEGMVALFELFAWPPEAVGINHSLLGWMVLPGPGFISGSSGGTVLMDGPKRIVASWATRYLLTVDTSYSTPRGAGWHLAGQVATFSVVDAEVSTSTERHVFAGWRGDVQHSIRESAVLMDGPKNVTAQWSMSYFLEVRTAFGQATGSGWYDGATTATVTLDALYVVGPTSRWHFLEWSGAVNSTAPLVTLLMDQAKHVEARWSTEHLLEVYGGRAEGRGAGWYAEGASVLVSLSANRVTATDGSWRFAGWEGYPESESSEIVIFMDGPNTMQARWAAVPPPPPPIDQLPAALAAAAGIVSAALVVLRTPRGEFALSALSVPLFTRLRTDEVRNQFTRGRILQFIEDSPGASYTTVRRKLALSNGACAYHLRVLERGGEIRRVVRGASVRFYGATYKFDAEALPPLAYFQRRILEVLVEAGSATFGEISETLAARGMEVTDTNLGYHLNVLAREKELIMTRREGRKTIYYLEGPDRDYLRRRLSEERGVDEAMDVAAISGGELARGDLDDASVPTKGDVLVRIDAAPHRNTNGAAPDQDPGPEKPR